MDIKALMNTMLSSDSIEGLGNLVGASSKDVKGVLSAALPALLDGAKGQADDTATAEGFVGALADHAKVDTGDIGSFFSGIDLEDGGKIVGHLLGAEKEATTQKAAEKAGVDVEKSGNILSAAAPLLMSLLGQQTASDGDNNNASGIAGLMGSLLGNIDLGGLIGGLFGGSSDNAAEEAAQQAGEAVQSVEEAKPQGLLGKILGLFKG